MEAGFESDNQEYVTLSRRDSEAIGMITGANEILETAGQFNQQCLTVLGPYQQVSHRSKHRRQRFENPQMVQSNPGDLPPVTDSKRTGLNQNESMTLENKPTLSEYLQARRNRIVYQRFKNDRFSQIKDSRKFAASTFVDLDLLRGPSQSFQQPKTIKPIFQAFTDFQRPAEQSPPVLDSQLEFDSAFESGNLLCAMAADLTAHYELVLQNDTNSKGYTQWFYFRVKSSVDGVFFFHILNLYKSRSRVGKALRPLIKKDVPSSEWHQQQDGSVFYTRSQLIHEQAKSKKLYALKFGLHLQKNCWYEVAYAQPYTYTSLKKYMTQLKKFSSTLKVLTLCRTINGHPIPYIQVDGSLGSPQLSNKWASTTSGKQIVYILARQHPGETPGSFVAEGVLNQLLSQVSDAGIYLRSNFLFKIIPMLNVDGVINGHNRTSLSGCDLNRKWDNPSPTIHPQIYFLKQMITNDGPRVKLFLDLHGHSKKTGSFFYGVPSHTNSNKTRLLPYLCSVLSPEVYYESCVFTISEKKRRTARAVISQLVDSKNAMTYEASMVGNRAGNIYSPADFRAMGKNLINALYQIYFLESATLPKSLAISQNMSVSQKFSSGLAVQANASRQVITERVKKAMAAIKSIQTAQDDSGSESEPEQQELTEKEAKSINQRKDQKLWKLTLKLDPKPQETNLIKKRINPASIREYAPSEEPKSKYSSSLPPARPTNFYIEKGRSESIKNKLYSQESQRLSESKLEFCLVQGLQSESPSNNLQHQQHWRPRPNAAWQKEKQRGEMPNINKYLNYRANRSMLQRIAGGSGSPAESSRVIGGVVGGVQQFIPKGYHHYENYIKTYGILAGESNTLELDYSTPHRQRIRSFRSQQYKHKQLAGRLSKIDQSQHPSY